jgi:glycosyltransferase involved in cell wall biosynthesis
MRNCDISIIVPALNEAGSLPLLLPRIAAALRGRDYEVVIVDDNSQDGTGEVCASLARTYPLRLLVRPWPKNGLSGAVLHGMSNAMGHYLLVMDADLQHPPERIPALLEPLEKGEADFVVGSRYAPGGSTEAKWGLFRQLNSRVATWLARPFAGKTHDPMSGFFALTRTSLFRADRLTPLGYKIGLELMTKCRSQAVREVPIHFGMRQQGTSKLTVKQQFKYLEHLSRLYDFCFPRASPMIKFLITTIVGWGVALALCIGLLNARVRLPWAPIFAYGAAVLSTAVFHLRYVRTQYEFLLRPYPWVDFSIISFAEWFTGAMAALWVAARVIHPTATELFVCCCGAATVMRYTLRKEFLLDLRGLRKEPRVQAPAVPAVERATQRAAA